MPSFMAVMVAKTTDIPNKEQVALVLQYVDSDFNVHEEFVGLYDIPAINATTLTAMNASVPNAFGLPDEKL